MDCLNSINDVITVAESKQQMGTEDWRELENTLVAREDHIVEHLLMAGVQFGLFPQIVAEVLAELGMGTPKTEEERALIRQAYDLLMEQIAQAQREEGGSEGTGP